MRLRPVKSSVPLFAKDLPEGWYKLNGATVDRLAIRSRLKWNRFDRATLDVDRRPGLAAFGAFLGTWKPISANPHPTKF